MKYLLCTDWETTGIPMDYQQEYDQGPQGIWLGAVVVETTDYNVVKTFERRVKYEGLPLDHPGFSSYEGLTWSDEAARIHGVSMDEALTGEPVAKVAEDFAWFVREFWPEGTHVTLCGHNPAFDRYFTKQMLYLAGKPNDVIFHHRMVDTFTLGFMLWGFTSSQTLFQAVGVDRTGTHSALEDALACAKVLKASQDFRIA